MSDAAAIADDDEAMLAELAGLVMSATRAAHERLMAAPDDKAFHEAGRTFQRMARSLRQTLALQARLKRDNAREAREAGQRSVREHAGRVDLHKARVRARVERHGWDEYEGEDYAEFVGDLDDSLERAVLEDDFATTPVEVLVARVRADMGLPDRADEPADASVDAPPEPQPVPLHSSG